MLSLVLISLCLMVPVFGCDHITLSNPQCPVPGYQFTASSWLPGHEPSLAHFNNGGAWIPHPLDLEPYIQVNIPYETTISGIITIGEEGTGNWVKSFRLEYYQDFAEEWYDHLGSFEGNTDDSSRVEIDLTVAPTHLGYPSQHWRIYPLDYQEQPALKFDLLGCEDCPWQIEVTPPSLGFCGDPFFLHNDCPAIASDTGRVSSSYMPTSGIDRIYLNTQEDESGTGGWMPDPSDPCPYVEVDTFWPEFISHFLIQGRNGGNDWVTSFQVMYRQFEDDDWNYMRDSDGNVQVFEGNTDSDSVVTVRVPGNFFLGQYFRIKPLTWHGNLAMRFDIGICRNCPP